MSLADFTAAAAFLAELRAAIDLSPGRETLEELIRAYQERNEARAERDSWRARAERAEGRRP